MNNNHIKSFQHLFRLFDRFKIMILILVTLVMVGCRNDITEIRAITEFQKMPVQTNYNAEYTYTEMGKIRNKIKATQLDQYNDELGTMEASGGFTLIFFDSLEVEEARLMADNGKFLQKEKKLIATGNVQLFNHKQERLETEELIFDQDSSLIFTDKFVKITTRNGDIFGKGLRSNESFTRYKILQPTGNIYMDEEDDLTPKSE